MLVLQGIVAGILAGAVMGLLSELGYRARVFHSSLFRIDGSFVADRFGKPVGSGMLYATGIVVHLVTSAMFGFVYVVATYIVGLPARTGGVIWIYVGLLWLSMLFVALPAAGQGVLGRHLGTTTWFEQLLLHVVFGLVFWQAL
jgi:hypothetical protein